MIPILVFVAAIAAGDPMNCPMHEEHMKAAAGVDQRHDTFGMSHDATHHNFRMFNDGGAIELRANAADDTKTIDAIRHHLHDIASRFNKNDFSIPMFVHDKLPAGVAEMKQLRKRIRYRYEDVDAGGRVRITTSDPKALDAVHAFLKFQVVEHRTTDPGTVEADK